MKLKENLSHQTRIYFIHFHYTAPPYIQFMLTSSDFIRQ